MSRGLSVSSVIWEVTELVYVAGAAPVLIFFFFLNADEIVLGLSEVKLISLY